MVTYKPRAEILNEIFSMVSSGLQLELVLDEITELYRLTDSEIAGFKNCYLFLSPYSPL